MTKLGRRSSYSGDNKKNNGIIKLNIIAKKLQQSLLLGKITNKENKTSSPNNLYTDEDIESTNYVPQDVKEGHFAVIAVDSEGPNNCCKRFVVPLSYLTHPTFLMLLEQAAEEYGFDHEGALMIPCRPSQLEKILEGQWEKKGDGTNGGDHVNWNTSTSAAMVQSC